MQHIFSNNDGMKLEFNNWKKFGDFANVYKLNNTLLNNQWIKEKKHKGKQKILWDEWN